MLPFKLKLAVVDKQFLATHFSFLVRFVHSNRIRQCDLFLNNAFKLKSQSFWYFFTFFFIQPLFLSRSFDFSRILCTSARWLNDKNKEKEWNENDGIRLEYCFFLCVLEIVWKNNRNRRNKNANLVRIEGKRRILHCIRHDHKTFLFHSSFLYFYSRFRFCCCFPLIHNATCTKQLKFSALHRMNEIDERDRKK